MATPLPWSHTALEDFKNCPKAYYHKRVVKDVVEEQGEAAMWGERVHKHFEEYVRDGKALPAELRNHQDYLDKLKGYPGEKHCELKIALDKKAQPCAFFGKQVWFRGVIDYAAIGDRSALIVDYKTGKPHQKMGQLKLFALHTFIANPDLRHVAVRYYWTQTYTTTEAEFDRHQIPEMWAEFIPDLRQYKQAFDEDIWQPRPTGLCYGWCPVTTCEHWKPKRRK